MAEKGFAFITGASGGMGRAAARLFAERGYRLWLTDRNVEGLAEAFPEACVERVDLTDGVALEALCAEVEACDADIALGYVNAGVIVPGAAGVLPRSAIDVHLEVNLRAAVHLAQALSRHMTVRKRGHIIATVSAAGMMAVPESAAYAASKFGLRGYMLSLAQEVRQSGVTVSCLYPNAVDTSMLRYEAREAGSPLVFLSKPSTVDDIVAALGRIERGRKLEYFVPRSDYVLAKLVTSFPSLMTLAMPLLMRIGARGKRKFLERIEAEGR